MKIRLVPVQVADDDERATLVAFVNGGYPSELPLTEQALAKGAYHFFWAFDVDSDERVGCCAYVQRTPFLAETVKTVVDPVQRGRGAGVAISQAIEDEVRRAGYKKVMTTILISNIPMIVIKLRQGYVVEGIHMDHEKPGLHEYSLGKVMR